MPHHLLSRRAFLEAGFLGCAACLLGAAPPPTNKKLAFRYVVGSSMYGNLPLAVILAEMRKAGMGEIDLWAKVHGTQRAEADELGPEKLSALLQEHGVRVPLTTRYDLGPFKLESEIHFLRGLGGQLIVVGAKGPPGLSEAPLHREVQKFVERMKPSLALAAEAGMVIAIENHDETLIASPDSLRWLAEYSEGHPLRIALAPYHLPQDPALIARLIADLNRQLVLFYAWQYGMGCMKPMPKTDELKQLPGRGELDFSPILKALQAINYTGWTEVLMHPTPRGIPILDTPGAVTAEISRAQHYLDQLAETI